MGTPSSVGNSPITIVSVSPKTNPVTIGRERNSAIQAIRSSPLTSRTTPAAIASADVIATASSGLSLEMSTTSDPETIATVEAGPTINCGDEPSTA